MFLKALAVVVLIQKASGIDPLVETEVGLIKGFKANDGDYFIFLGIPYASVDQANPFGPSTPYPPFNETYEAFNEYAVCPQIDGSTITSTGSLDCLHLNIYVPNSASTRNPVPVIVSIHGGGFARGSGGRSLFGPKFLIRHDIIIVSFNYRVGAYGFMCLGTPEVPGNQGLKDQLIALQWVKTNIKSFGGDPDRITIFGQSAGGRSVDFHLMAEDQNLFNKVIMHSGNSFSSLSATPGVGEVNTEQPKILAEHLGFRTDNFSQAVTFLNTVDPKLVVSAAYDRGVLFKPCVESELQGVETFVTDFTINRAVPNVKKMPILMGYNDKERLFAHVNTDDTYYKEFDLFEKYLKSYFDFNEEQQNYFEKLVRKFYIGDEVLTSALREEIGDFDSDLIYIYPTHRRANQYLANGAQKIYQYVFSYNGGRNHFQVQNISLQGAVHGDELNYLFSSDALDSLPDTVSVEDQAMIDRMTTMWTNFVKYGDPTPETSDLLPVKWEPITEGTCYYYSIDSEISLRISPFNQRIAFLNLLFEMNEEYQIGLR